VFGSRTFESWVVLHAIIHLFRLVGYYRRSLKVVPFESLGAVSYSSSIVTVAVSVAVSEIFSVKACDLENWG